MDVLNSALQEFPGTLKTIDVECIQKITWASFWGPKVLCTPIQAAIATKNLYEQENNTNDAKSPLASTAQLPTTAKTTTTNNKILASNISGTFSNFPFSNSKSNSGSSSSSNSNESIGTSTNNSNNNQSHIDALQSAVDTFKCNLYSRHASTYEAIFNCTSAYADNARQYLNDSFKNTVNCVYNNVSMIIKSVQHPVSEIELILPKLTYFKTNNFNNNDNNRFLNETNNILRHTAIELLQNAKSCLPLSSTDNDNDNNNNQYSSNNSINTIIAATASTTNFYDDNFNNNANGVDNINNVCINLNQILICNHLVANNSLYENESFDKPINSTFMEPVKCLLNLYCVLNGSAIENDRLLLNTSSNNSSESTIIQQYYGFNNATISTTTSLYSNQTNYDYNDANNYDWTFLLVIVFIFGGSLGNLLVCLAVALDRKLQNVTNYFLFSLAIADLLVSLFVMPLGAIPSFLGKFNRQQQQHRN